MAAHNRQWARMIGAQNAIRGMCEAAVTKCSVFGCQRRKGMFIGYRGSWLGFCLSHRKEAVALNTYFANHPNSRPHGYDKEVRLARCD